MRRLFVVTHPESEHHVAGLVGGWYDAALTPRGRHEADLIASRLLELGAAERPVAVVTSDLRRTVQTAEAIATALGVEPGLDRDLREKSYGVAEGRPQSWLDERFRFPPADGNRLDHDEGVDGAETRRDLGARVYAAVDRVLASKTEHHVVVTHGFALTFVVASWIGMPLEATGRVAFRARSGGVTLLEEDDRFHNRAVTMLDDVAHLTDS